MSISEEHFSSGGKSQETPEDRAKAIFLSALEIEAPDERDSYVVAECGDSKTLLHEVERLMSHHDEAGSFLESPPPGADLAPTIDYSIAEKPGSQIGPYKLLQKIGEGGMGVVYMAEQKMPVKRRVALKIIKPGMDTEQVIARFEAERQALAMMDHPGIAKVLEAGATDSGRPYFVMELVKGVSITEYCDRNRLNPSDRVKLFVDVCHAVQHAHQKGIIHRDLKPSNVLVAKFDDRPAVKVIDFGVAKATNQELTERTMFTQFGQIVGTLEYMSPEQAQFNQLDIDTRSDIYSLGVLFYELLTGETPFDGERLRSSAFEEVLRILREEEPPKPSNRIITLGEKTAQVSASRSSEPSKLGAFVRGDLDWIVMKAMEKDRARRYSTAFAFAEDIQRFLDDEPIDARPPSLVYRIGKMTRRNRTLVIATGLIIAAVLTGTAMALYGLVESRIAWQEAQQKTEQLQGLMEEYVDVLLAQGFLEAVSGESERAELTASKLDLLNAKKEADLILGAACVFRGDFPTAQSHLKKTSESVAGKSLLAVAALFTNDMNRHHDLLVDIEALEPESDYDILFYGYSELFRNQQNAAKLLQTAVDQRPSPLGHALLAIALVAAGFDLDKPSYIDGAVEYATRADAAVPDNRFIESTNLFVHCAAIIKKTSIDEESSLHRERAGYFAQRVALSTSPQIRAPRLLYFELIDSSDQYVAEARELIRLGWQSDQPIAGLYVHGERDAARQLARASDEIDSRIANAYLEFDNPLRRQEIREDYEEVISQTREPNTILNAIQMLILLGDDGRARSEAQRLLSSVVSYDQNMLRERLEFIAATSPSAKQLVLAAGDSRYKRAVVEYQLGVICLGGHDRIGATLHFRESIRLNDFLTPYSHWTRVFLEKIDEPQN